MLLLSDDTKWTILHIATLALSSGAFHGQKTQYQKDKGIIHPSDIASNEDASTSEDSNMGSSNEFLHASHERMRTLLKTLESGLVDIDEGFSTVEYVANEVSILFKILEYRANRLQSICSDLLSAAEDSSPLPAAGQVKAGLQGIADVVVKLKLHIPSRGPVRVESASDLINYLIKLPTYKEFGGHVGLHDFEENYRSLDSRSKNCLFCFSVFPEGYVVKKTLIMYWWVGESLIDPELDGDKAAEEVANEIVTKFMVFGFVEPMIEKGKLVGLRMNPVIRYVVVYLAERAGFCDFDFTWNPTADFHLSGKAFLVEIEGEYSRQLLFTNRDLNPGKLQTLININDSFPISVSKLFSRMRKVNVLCLGNWAENFSENFSWSPPPHPRSLRLENKEFSKGLKYMKHLKFLSIRKVVDIVWIPLSKNINLRILDLNKCRNLKRISSYVSSLQRLTHLDVCGCQILDGLPKGIGRLKELQVLKGSVPPDPEDTRFCTLDDLKRLKKLRKLSICNCSRTFPTSQELNALWHMRSLRKLKVQWRRYHRPEVEALSQLGMLPQDLQKLELEEYPMTRAPDWLVPSKLKSLKKLYIIGGSLHNLHQAQGENEKWKVQILRFRSLPEFHMDWTRVEDEFPNLIYVERDECPKLTSFPCKDHEVWLNKKMPSQNLLKELGFSWSFMASGTC